EATHLRQEFPEGLVHRIGGTHRVACKTALPTPTSLSFPRLPRHERPSYSIRSHFCVSLNLRYSGCRMSRVTRKDQRPGSYVSPSADRSLSRSSSIHECAVQLFREATELLETSPRSNWTKISNLRLSSLSAREIASRTHAIAQ